MRLEDGDLIWAPPDDDRVIRVPCEDYSGNEADAMVKEGDAAHDHGDHINMVT